MDPQSNLKSMPATINKETNTLETDELSICVIGHVDAGKSSLCGRILLETGKVTARQMEKQQKEADQMGKGSFALAHCMDTHKEERNRGITISAATTQFTTLGKKRLITLTDAPGHRDFINNMISGASQCNAAILVVSSKEAEFRAGISQSGQTYEHTLLINALGVRNLIVAVNKMDDESVQWSEAKFNEIKQEFTNFYKKIGGDIKNCQFVPVSGFLGLNIKERYHEKFWKGECLLEMIDNWPYIKSDLTIPFRMALSGVHKVSGIGSVYAGKVVTGALNVGDHVESLPSTHIKAQIKSIEKFHKQAKIAYAGDNIGITLKGMSDAAGPKKGDIIAAKDTGLIKVFRFNAVFMGTMPKEAKMDVGFRPVLSNGTAKSTVTIVKIESVSEKVKGDKAWKDVTIERNGQVKKGDMVKAVFQPDNGNLCIETEVRYGILTRFVLRNGTTTIAIGQCKKIDNENYDKDFKNAKKEAAKAAKKTGGK